MDAPLRVVIADDHSLVRRGTREILQQDPAIEIVGEAADGDAAVRIVADLLPDVVLVDIGMPIVNGIDVTRTIASRWPEMAVIVLTIHDDAEYVWEAIRAGASGYLLKDVADEELVKAVHTVYGGGAVLDPAVTDLLMKRVRQEEAAEPPGTALTERELQVLDLAAAGRSNRQIGEALAVSPRTVEVHMHRVFKKLGTRSRTEAVVVAARRGLLDLESEQ